MKINTRVILSLLLVLTLSFSSIGVVSASENNEDEIKSVIELYFTNELESIRKGNMVNNDSIIKYEKLIEYANLNNDLKASWYNEIEERLIDYKLLVDYESINFKGNSCEVIVNKGVDLIFEKSPEIVQKARGESHIFILKKFDDRWFIEKDIFEEGENANLLYSEYIKDINYAKMLDRKMDVLREKKTKVKDEAVKLKEDLVKSNKIFENSKNNQESDLSILTTYDGNAAVDYAYIYWGPDSSDWNTAEYSSYDSDCTNFVSQCIHAGGIPTTTTWHKDTYAWIRVVEFRDYLVNNSIATEYSWQSNCKEGDVILLLPTLSAKELPKLHDRLQIC